MYLEGHTAGRLGFNSPDKIKTALNGLYTTISGIYTSLVP